MGTAWWATEGTGRRGKPSRDRTAERKGLRELVTRSFPRKEWPVGPSPGGPSGSRECWVQLQPGAQSPGHTGNLPSGPHSLPLLAWVRQLGLQLRLPSAPSSTQHCRAPPWLRAGAQRWGWGAGRSTWGPPAEAAEQMSVEAWGPSWARRSVPRRPSTPGSTLDVVIPGERPRAGPQSRCTVSNHDP